MKMKVCRKCKKSLGAEAFSKNSEKKDGLANQCRKCKSEYMKAYNAGHKTPRVRRALLADLRIPSGGRLPQAASAAGTISLDGAQERIEAQLAGTICEIIDIRLEKFGEGINHQLRGELIKSRAEVKDLKDERRRMIDEQIEQEARR